MHSKSLTRFHTPTHAVIMDYHFLLMQYELGILSFIFIHGEKLSRHPSTLRIKVAFNIRNILLKGNIFVIVTRVERQ